MRVDIETHLGWTGREVDIETHLGWTESEG